MPPYVSRSLAIGAFAFASFATLASGCASSSNAPIEAELSKMRRDLAEMKKHLSDTELAVQRLEGQVTLLSLGKDAVDRAPTTQVASGPKIEQERAIDNKKARSQQKPDRVLPVVRLSGKAEAPSAQNAKEEWVDPGALDDGSPPLVIQMGPDTGERIPVDHDVLKKPDPVLGAAKATKPAPEKIAAKPAPSEATSADMESEYQAALTMLRADSRPAEALAMFELFRVNHPRSNLADNASYWIGECHFALKAYDRAITTFGALTREHPKSPKVADAMLRIGESHLALGDRTKAQSSFDQLIKAYPRSDAAQSARARLESLTSNGGR